MINTLIMHDAKCSNAICDSICAYLDLFIDLLIVLFILEECLMKLKSKLLTAGLIATAVVPLAACGNGGSNQGGESTGEKTFVYGTTGYGKDMLNVGTNPHDGYTGWSTLRYGIGETLFKYDDSMQIQPWLAKSYEFVDDTHVKIELRDDVIFQAVERWMLQQLRNVLMTSSRFMIELLLT